MKITVRLLIVAAIVAGVITTSLDAETFRFFGDDWIALSGTGGPGPNN
jgi:hypothetical protein